MIKVAIQGNAGCFHEIAAHRFYENEKIETVYCDTFEDVFSAMQANPEECLGMIAIENTIAGSLLHNYELLRDNGSHIVGEYKLHIEHALLCLPAAAFGADTDFAFGDIVVVVDDDKL